MKNEQTIDNRKLRIPSVTWRFGLGCVLLGLAAWVHVESAEIPKRVAPSIRMPVEPAVSGYGTSPVFPGLQLTHPIDIAFAPGETNRLFVAEQGGRILAVTNLAGPQLSVWLDLSDVVYEKEETGLLGLAFHPQFTANRFFYVFYTLLTESAQGHGIHDRLSRFEADPADPGRARRDSEVVMISQFDRHPWHQAGGLAFGPDGYLYVALGDEGGEYDLHGNGQRIDRNFFSAILRIDVDERLGNFPPNPHPAVGGGYLVPRDNPFVHALSHNGQELDPRSIRTEFFVTGLRNPFRFAFDPATGDLYLNDVGQAHREEVNLGLKGANYGWPFHEGTFIHENLLPAATNGLRLMPPLAEYGYGGGVAGAGNAVTAGLLYRGHTFPELHGAYLLADFWSGRIGLFVPEVGRINQIRALQERMDALQSRLHTTTPELEEEQRRWEARYHDLQNGWITLEPESFSALSGATLTRQPDGSILAGGVLPEVDTYVVEAAAPLQTLTGFRIETLTDSTLPGSGPGRRDGGIFVLSEVSLAFVPGGQSAVVVPLANAMADFAQEGWPAAAAIDGITATGWAVYPELGRPHVLQLEPQTDLRAEPGDRLRIRLDQRFGDRAVLGRFRIQVTSVPRPLEIPRHPEYIRTILETPSTERRAAEAETLSAYFRATTASLAEVRAELDELRREQIRLMGQNTAKIEWVGAADTVSSMRTHPSTGDIFMTDWNGGRILKLEPASPATQPEIPETLSQTGVFKSVQSLVPQDGVVGYEINAPFWSDHAHKRRWFALLNDDSFMDFRESENWSFPAGTVWVKHFDLEMIKGVPASARRIETRLLVKGTNSVYGVTYRWDETGTDAWLVPSEGAEETFQIRDGGIIRSQVWKYPGRADCRTCHTSAGGHALGFNTPQLNRPRSEGDPRNQIEWLGRLGYLRSPAPATNTWESLAPANDANASLQHRVRSYLFSNCAQCHQPGGPGRAAWDARIKTPLESMGLVNAPALDTLNRPGSRIVKPGSLEQSVLYRRIAEWGEHHMPPLGTTVINQEAVDLLRDWILDELPQSNAGQNIAPTVTITAPADRALVSAGSTVQIIAGAADSDGSVREVELFANGKSLGTRQTRPYTWNWQSPVLGPHFFAALATDNQGARQLSRPVQVNVTFSEAAAVFSGEDRGTSGDWYERYGTEGFDLAGGPAQFPAYAQVQRGETPAVVWSDQAAEFRALAAVRGPGRLAAAWWGNEELSFDLNLTDDRFHQVALYFLDWDGGDRVATVQISDLGTGRLLDARRVAGFREGTYLVWFVQGRVRIRVQRASPANAVLSGIFIDAAPDRIPTARITQPEDGEVFVLPAAVTVTVQPGIPVGNVHRIELFSGATSLGELAGPPFAAGWRDPAAGGHVLSARITDDRGVSAFSPPVSIRFDLPDATASFLWRDDLTIGNWRTPYGRVGHWLAGQNARLPGFVEASLSGAETFVWSAVETAPEALDAFPAPSRLAAAWHAPSRYDLRLRFQDGRPRRLALYLLDWDGDNQRSQDIQIIAARSGRILDARRVEAFAGGSYLAWAVQGDVLVRLIARNAANVVGSALFIDDFSAPTEAWRAQWFRLAERLNPEISDDTGDPDGDGLSNLFEYATGSSPVTANPPPAIGLSWDHTGVFFSFPRAKGASDVAVVPEVTSDFVTWRRGPGNVEEAGVSDAGKIEIVRVRVGSDMAGQGQVFFRIRVERQ